MAWISTGYTDPETGDWVDMSYDDGQGGDVVNPVDVTTAEPSVDQPAIPYSDYESKKIKEAAAQATDPALKDTSWLEKIGTGAFNAIKARYTDASGNTDWSKVLKDGLTAGAGLLAYNQASQPIPKTGYQGGIPSLVASRQQLAPVAGARPGAGGQRYFTDTTYAPAAGLPAAQAATATQAATMNAQNLANQQAQAAQAPPALTAEQQQAASDKFFGRAPVQAAHGGLMGLAHGGSTTHPGGTYLQGPTDGMADKIHATIDGNQPARLAHGEFVIPADVVSHLGNGNSDAGAKQLYSMMDRIRQARTGTKKQGKEINPEKFTPGGIAGYAAGGEIKHFATGDIVAPTGTTGSEQSLATWAGPYVTEMLGQGQALANQPYQAYQGPLTAGPSALQEQGFSNAANIATPASIGQAATTAGGLATTPQTSSFNTEGTAAAYMSPYEQNVVEAQQQEAQRTADIASTQRHGAQTMAGAYGGSRGAIMDAEAARNLAIQKGTIQATGLQDAFKAAQQQFNTEQTTGLAGKTLNLNAAQAEGQLGAQQAATGLAGLNTQLTAGAQQRDITQQGVLADQAAFTAERENPYKMVQYQQSLLQGLPIAAQNYSILNSPINAAAAGASAVNTLLGGTSAPKYDAQTGAKLP